MQERNRSLDLIKTIAMLGVMCLHSQSGYYDNPIAQFLYMTAVVSIPLFFMVSGYLMFGKNKVDYHYSLRKILGILRFVAIITVAFWLAYGWRHHSSFIDTTAGSLIQHGGMAVFWYFGAMMIIYALLPVLHGVYSKHPRGFNGLTIAMGVIAMCIFSLNFVGLHIEQHTIQTFRIWNWIFYFCMGGILRRYAIPTNAYVVIALFAANYLAQYFLTPLMPNQACEYFYPSVLTMLLAIALFSFLMRLKVNKVMQIGGGYFLPCYTIHTHIIPNVQGWYDSVIPPGLFHPFFFWLFVVFITMTVSWVIMKIPYMDKVFRV